MAGDNRDRDRGDREWSESVVAIRRCAAVVKGGRRFSFNALVVVGNGQGPVAWGYGKANEVPPAVEKGVKDAHKQMNRVTLKGGTIPHRVIGKFGAARVVMLPASPGTGVIAGGAVRAVVQAAGVTDILTKSFGSTNKLNLVKAAIDAPEAAPHEGRRRAAPGSDPLMQLHDVHQGIHKNKKRKRIGRGTGSGHGKTAGKGHKGHSSRQGFKTAPSSKAARSRWPAASPSAASPTAGSGRTTPSSTSRRSTSSRPAPSSTRRPSAPAGSSRAATTTASRSSATARSPRP